MVDLNVLLVPRVFLLLSSPSHGVLGSKMVEEISTCHKGHGNDAKSGVVILDGAREGQLSRNLVETTGSLRKPGIRCCTKSP